MWLNRISIRLSRNCRKYDLLENAMLAVVGNNSEPLRLAFTSNNLQINRVLGEVVSWVSQYTNHASRQMKGNK